MGIKYAAEHLFHMSRINARLVQKTVILIVCRPTVFG